MFKRQLPAQFSSSLVKNWFKIVAPQFSKAFVPTNTEHFNEDEDLKMPSTGHWLSFCRVKN